MVAACTSSRRNPLAQQVSAITSEKQKKGRTITTIMVRVANFQATHRYLCEKQLVSGPPPPNTIQVKGAWCQPACCTQHFLYIFATLDCEVTRQNQRHEDSAAAHGTRQGTT